MSGHFSSSEISGIGMTSQRIRDRMISTLKEEGIQNARVLEVLALAPRHLFVEPAFSDHAYRPEAVPIGFGQTLSQPWTVARMSELVCRESPQRILEIGTGSGFQTYILARLCPHVFSIERIDALRAKARQRLHRLSVSNVRLRHDDGRRGWSVVAPFDVILVTACTRKIHPEWIEQLRPGGAIIAPLLDEEHNRQWLVRARKHKDTVQVMRLEPVNFVPLLDGVIE